MKILSLTVPIILLTSCGGDSDIIPVIGEKPEEEDHTSKPMAIHVIAPDTPGVNLGKAVNDHLGVSQSLDYSTCVDIAKSERTANSTGSYTNITLQKVESTQDLFEKTNRNIALSLALKGWGKLAGIEASGGSETNQSWERSLKHDSSYALLTIEKTYMPINATEVKFKNGLVAAYSDNPERMLKTCGTGYISSVTLGARALGLIECHSSNFTEKKNVDQKINASVGNLLGSGSAGIKQTLEGIANATTKGCEVFISLAGGVGRPTTDFDKFAEQLIDYVDAGNVENAVALSFATSAYNSVLDFDFQNNLADSFEEILYRQDTYIKTKESVLEFKLSELADIDKLLNYGPPTEDVVKKQQRLFTETEELSRKILGCATKYECTTDGEW